MWSLLTALSFFAQNLCGSLPVHAQPLILPSADQRLMISTGYTPSQILGLTTHSDNPLTFDFFIVPGDSRPGDNDLEFTANQLVRYFMASLTIPENQMWVNLSPYERDRIIPQAFGLTEMGRDLLAQDYLLKHLTASLLHPDEPTGQSFWNKIRQKARERFGTEDIPLISFSKIWILPDKAVVFEQGLSAFVVESRLKVMLEDDYLALQHHREANPDSLASRPAAQDPMISGLSAELIRDILLPALEDEINSGATFANLRQIYQSMILAAWYKQTLKDSPLGQIYIDQAKTKGVESEDPLVNRQIYARYLDAFREGVTRIIRDDYDPLTQQIIPRRYFSGGVNQAMLTQNTLEVIENPDVLSLRQRATLGRSADKAMTVTVDMKLLPAPEETTDPPKNATHRLQEIDRQPSQNWNQHFKVPLGVDGINLIQAFIKQQLRAHVIFGDMSKIGAMNSATNRKLMDILIPAAISIINLRFQPYGGLAIRISGDEIGMVLPENLTNENAAEILQHASSAIAAEIPRLGFGAVTVQGLTAENAEHVRWITAQTLGNTHLHNLFSDADGEFITFDHPSDNLEKDLENALTVVNAALASVGLGTVTLRRNPNGPQIPLYTPRITAGFIRANEAEKITGANTVEEIYSASIRLAEFILNLTKEKNGTLGFAHEHQDKVDEFGALLSHNETDDPHRQARNDLEIFYRKKYGDLLNGTLVNGPLMENHFPVFKRVHLIKILKEFQRRYGNVTLVKIDPHYFPKQKVKTIMDKKKKSNPELLEKLRGRPDGSFGIKVLNDMLGHTEGDQIIGTLVNTINQILMNNADWGRALQVRAPPDGIYLVIPGLPKDSHIQTLIETIQNNMNTNLPTELATVRLVASLSSSPDNIIGAPELIKSTDAINQRAVARATVRETAEPRPNYLEFFDPSPEGRQQLEKDMAHIRSIMRKAGVAILESNFGKAPDSTDAQPSAKFQHFLQRQPTPVTSDQAMLTPKEFFNQVEPSAMNDAKAISPDTVGGIDLNPAAMTLDIRRDPQGRALVLPDQFLESQQIEGFLPVIIQITPATHLPFLLGLSAKPVNEFPVPVAARLSIQTKTHF